MKLEIKDCKVAAEMIHMAIENKELREKIILQQNDRLKEFAYLKTKDKIMRNLKGFIE